MNEARNTLIRPGGTRLEVIRFVLVGGIAALVNVLMRIALNVTMSYEHAVTGAYIFGMTTAFVLNKIVVFAPSGRAVSGEYLRFGLVNAVAFVQVYFVSIVLARSIFPWLGFTWHPETIAHGIGVIMPVFTSYFGHKYFSFATAER